MTRESVLHKIQAHRADLAQLGVRSLSLFGSVARDEAGPDSDVDVLVEFAGPTTFEAYMDVVLALQDWLGRRVDVVTVSALARKPSWRQSISEDLLRVA